MMRTREFKERAGNLNQLLFRRYSGHRAVPLIASEPNGLEKFPPFRHHGVIAGQAVLERMVDEEVSATLRSERGLDADASRRCRALGIERRMK
jgi:hypothetical protein